MGSAASNLLSEDTWSVIITLTYEKIVIDYHITSTGLIEKKITADGREVTFHVNPATREMVDLSKAHVGRDGDFDDCSVVLASLVATIKERWSTITVDNSAKEAKSIAPTTKWIVDVKIPSELKTVDYTLTSDNEVVVKKVTCVSTQKSTLFNVDLSGDTKMVDETPTGTDGERDKMVDVLTKLCTVLNSY
jgi:hypothetical protein